VSTDVSEEHIASNIRVEEIISARNQRESRWRWRRYVPPKRLLTFNGLHGVISQKMILFITTAVRNSNPTCIKLYLLLVGCLAYFLTLKMEVVRFSENMVYFCQTTWHHEPEDSITSYFRWDSLECRAAICVSTWNYMFPWKRRDKDTVHTVNQKLYPVLYNYPCIYIQKFERDRRLPEPSDSKIWSWVSRDSDQRITMLVGRVNCCWPSPAQSLPRGGEDQQQFTLPDPTRYKSSASLMFIIIFKQFRFIIATNCWALTSFINVRYVAAHERTKSISFSVSCLFCEH
jgi:hypothetical protein